MSTLGMSMANQERRDGAAPPRTLDFRQAMRNFRTMFPTLNSELIECVLRSNAGHVDSTIDQLLQLSQETGGRRPGLSTGFDRQWRMGNRMDGDSTDSDDSVPSEIFDPPTSSDEDIPVRDPPPMYTPRDSNATGGFFNEYPVQVLTNEEKKSVKESARDEKRFGKVYKAWSPPMLGVLPEDFLRILPQQFLTLTQRERSKGQRSLSSQKKYSSSASAHRTMEAEVPVSATRSPPLGSSIFTPHEGVTPPPGVAGPVIDNSAEEELTPPPRPPRDAQPPRRLPPQYNERDRSASLRQDHIEQGNLFIRSATDNRSLHHHHSLDGNVAAHGQRQRRHHHHRSSRSTHGSSSSRYHNPQALHQHHQSLSSAASNSNHARRNSDFSSRRMVMVSRSSEPITPFAHDGSPAIATNGVHSPSNERSSHRSSQRSSLNSFSHHHQSFPDRQSAVFYRSDVSGLDHSRPIRSTNGGASSSGGRMRPRTAREEEQYVEDCKLAILLQNEEFIRELKRNDEFLQVLEKDRPVAPVSADKPAGISSPDKELVPLPDPDAKYPHGTSRCSSLKKEGSDEIDKDDKAFKENLKHMGKSTRKKFNEIAKKFSVRRKTSYKSMKNIDPVFANCDDNFDEAPGPCSAGLDS